MKSYEEMKEILERNYSKYFELLNYDMVIRKTMNYNTDKEIKEYLDKCLDHYIECEKIKLQNTADKLNGLWQQAYEKDLEIYNRIKED